MTALTGVGVELGEVRVVFREVAPGVTFPYFAPAAEREHKDSGSLDTL